MKIPLLPLFASLAVFVCHALPAAERVALVIGNNAYQHGSALKNCVNDATAVAAGLKACGFEVTLVTDSGLQNLEEKLREFKRAATGAKAAWFYYAGHGAEVAGSNYLIPVDARVEEEFEVKHKTLPLDQVIGALDTAGTPLKVIVLDSCRDNPFDRAWSRSGAKGLAQVGDTPKGTIIAYATAPGKVAADGNGANSPYTTSLVGALAKPGLEIEQVFKETGRAVMEATGDKQTPWLNMSFYGNFVMRAAGSGPPPVVHRPSPPMNPAPAKVPTAPSVVAGSLDRGKVGSSHDVKLPGGVKMTFCYCPPGSFTMGSPVSEKGRIFNEDQVTVRIGKGFWLARTETTQAQWRGVMGTDPSHFKGAGLPVEKVSWDEAREFIRKLNVAGGLPAGWKWSLPSEAQWEYACRAGTSTVFSFGNSLNGLEANTNGNYPYGTEMKGRFLEKTQLVGSYAANAWGLHDIHGNVAEWCGDWYADRVSGGDDPAGPASGVSPVYRGGSWFYGAASCRAARRDYHEESVRNSSLGFRAALVPSK